MLTLTKGSDGTALAELNFMVERGTDTSPAVSVRITNTGLTDVEGAFLSFFVEKTPGERDWVTTGHPAVDELWGRFQLTGASGVGQEYVPDGIQPMGHLATAQLPKILGGGTNYVTADVWLRQPEASAGGSAVNCRLLVGGDSPARGVPTGVAAAAWGVVSGVNQRRSVLLTGNATTATLVNDDEVHVSAGTYLIDGFEYSNILEDITLNQNDGSAVALGVGESYYAALTRGAGTVTTTKGDLSAGTPTKPTLPTGELFLAFVLVNYGAGGSVIAPGDIESDISYWRLLSEPPNTGLTTVIHPGESLTGGYQQFHAVKETVILQDSTSNWVWMQYGGALAVTQTAVAPSAGAIPLWLHVTDGSGVTATTDLRPFIGEQLAPSRWGGGTTERMLEEEITLDTGATLTDSVADLLPANSRILAVGWIITETITTAINFQIGDTSTANRFLGTTATITAGDSGIAMDHVGSAAEVQATADKIEITTNANPGAGKIRIQVHALIFSPPTA